MSTAELSLSGLERLLEVTRRLAAPFELMTMLGAVAGAARELLQAERCSVWLHDAATGELVLKVASDIHDVRVTMGTGLVGACAAGRALINVSDCYADARFDPVVDRRTGFRTRCMLALPMVDHAGALVGVMQIINRAAGVFDAADERLAQALAAQCAVALQRVHMTQALLDGERMRQELEVARVVQMSTLPSLMPVLAGYDCFGLARPALMTGGDTFDLALHDAGLLVVLADATGHGVGPALSVTQMHAMLRMGLQLGAPLEALFMQLNNLLAQTLAEDRFITAFIGLLDAPTHTLHYLSAGQGPILHFHAASGQCTQHGPSCFPLGAMLLPAPRPAQHMLMQPGDVLVLLSDGIYEYANARGEAFGSERVEACLAAHQGQGMAVLAQALLAEVQCFAAGAVQEDDITLVLVKRDAAVLAIRLAREAASLPVLFAFTKHSCAQLGVAQAVGLRLDFVLEELFTNIVKYSGGSAPVALSLCLVGGALEVQLDDPDGQPFDPTQAPDADTSLPAAQRQPGGLGLHLIKRLVDTMEYTHDPASGRGRIRFRLQTTPPLEG